MLLPDVSRASRRSERPADPPCDDRARRTTGTGSARRRPARPAPIGQQDRGGHGDQPERSTSTGSTSQARSGLRRVGTATIGFVGGRRIPFEQPPMRDQHPPRGAHDRIEADRRLVRQKRERQRRLRDVPAGDASPWRRDAGRSSTSSGLRNRSTMQRTGRRKQQDRDHHQCPQPGLRKHRPAEQQQQRQRRRDEAAPQVVEDLPLRQRRQRIPDAVACRGRARAAAAIPRAASRRESSDAGGSRPRYRSTDTPRTTARRSTAPSARSNLRADRGSGSGSRESGPPARARTRRRRRFPCR